MLELSLLPSDCLAHFNEFRGEPSGIRVDVTPQHGALTYMILDVPLPLFIRPHLPVHSLLPNQGASDKPCKWEVCHSSDK
jgi:hypothetical protein